MRCTWRQSPAGLAAVGFTILAAAWAPTPAGGQGTVPALTCPAAGASHHQAAAQDAIGLLARLVLPAGAQSSASEPPGDGGALSQPAVGPPATPCVLDRPGWWTVAMQPADVMAFIEAHPPAGSTLKGHGSSQGPGHPPESALQFGWPPLAGILQTRSLAIGVVGLPGATTGVRADAQVVWIVPRSPDERIPRQAHVLTVTVGRPGHRPSRSVTATNRAKVQRIASLIDALGIVQPGVVSCPAAPSSGSPVVTFTFRAHRRGRVLARASELAAAREPTTACDSMKLSIRGRARTPLLGGAAVVHKAQALFGVKLTRSASPVSRSR